MPAGSKKPTAAATTAMAAALAAAVPETATMVAVVLPLLLLLLLLVAAALLAVWALTAVECRSSSPMEPRAGWTLRKCKQINTSHTHTHTHTDREQHPRHRHTHAHGKNNTPTPQTNTSHKHLTTLEGGAHATAQRRCRTLREYNYHKICDRCVARPHSVCVFKRESELQAFSCVLSSNVPPEREIQPVGTGDTQITGLTL